MLEESFITIIMKFKYLFYKRFYDNLNNKDSGLTSTEAFCLDAIYILNRPTITELAKFLKISNSNVAYRIMNLINKGYVKKIQSQFDKREYYLLTTNKYDKYYGIDNELLESVTSKLEMKLTREEIKKLDQSLRSVMEELEEENNIWN